MSAWKAWKLARLIGIPIWGVVTIYAMTLTRDVITDVVLGIILIPAAFWWIAAFHDIASAPQFRGRRICVNGTSDMASRQAAVRRYLDLQGAIVVQEDPEISVFVAADRESIIGLIEDRAGNSKRVTSRGSFWPRILTNEISAFVLEQQRRT